MTSNHGLIRNPDRPLPNPAAAAASGLFLFVARISPYRPLCVPQMPEREIFGSGYRIFFLEVIVECI